MNTSASAIHSRDAQPHRALAEMLRPQFCGRTISDVFFGKDSTLLVFDNGSVLEVGAWVLSPTQDHSPA